MDPTRDTRLLAFLASVPRWALLGPRDRWFVRQAIAGRVPEVVRLNTIRGAQGSDLGPRVLGCAEEVRAAIEDVALSPSASELVSVARLRRGLTALSAPNPGPTAAMDLLRGLATGIFRALNR